MRIVITGASGLVGSHLAARFPDAIALTHRDLDITDADAVRGLNADRIFNCAVIGVDDCEADPELAERINVLGPANLASVAAHIVHFSTNYVFDGGRTSGVPYAPDDDAQPINVYGATKLRGERAVLAANPRALIVRTSWVYGPGKNSFLATVAARLARGERVQAITDTFAGTTYVHDLVERVAQLVEQGASGIHHVVNDGVCSYESFALEAARLVGASPELIDRTSESAHRRPAARPRWTPLQCEPALRGWEEALAAAVRDSRSER